MRVCQSVARCWARLFPCLVVSFGLLVCSTGCMVPRHRLEVAEAKYAEQSSRYADSQRKLAWKEAHLQEALRNIASLEARLNERSTELEVAEQGLAEKAFEVDRSDQEGVESAQLVAQLRGELGRTASHVEQLARERDTLQGELTELRLSASTLGGAGGGRPSAEQIAKLAFALGSPLKHEKITLEDTADGLVVRFKAGTLFAAQRNGLKTEGARLLQKLGRVVGKWDRRLELSVDGGLGEEQGLARVREAEGALVSGGVEFERLLHKEPGSGEVPQGEAADLIVKIAPPPQS